MKHLLNTLFVTSSDIYLSLDGENVVAKKENAIVARYPLHTLGNIVTFSYSGASPALMGACAEREIAMAFCSPRGKFLARICGDNCGNVILRREQYRIADDEERACRIAVNMLIGKLYNSRWSIERTARDHAMRVDVPRLKSASSAIAALSQELESQLSFEHLRGVEGVAATEYFGVLDEMILNEDESFRFSTRNRRPPLDAVNAMLSFAYSLLSHDCAAALECNGLDSYVGFLHRDRAGRASLALDLMEELRPCMADRFVLTMINNRRIKSSDFIFEESGCVRLTDDGRRSFLSAWQEKKREMIKHPYLDERIEWGMVPHVQALLLARHIRGDIDGYPPFLWK